MPYVVGGAGLAQRDRDGTGLRGAPARLEGGDRVGGDAPLPVADIGGE